MSSLNITPQSFVYRVRTILAHFANAINHWLPSGCCQEFSEEDIINAILFANTPENWKEEVSSAYYRSNHYNAVIGNLEQESIGDGLCAIWALIIDQMHITNQNQRYRMCAIMRAISIAQQARYPESWTEYSDDDMMGTLLFIFNRNIMVFNTVNDSIIDGSELFSNCDRRKAWSHFGEKLYEYALCWSSNAQAELEAKCDQKDDVVVKPLTQHVHSSNSFARFAKAIFRLNIN